MPLLVNLIITKLELFLSHTCLTGFEKKDFDKRKHVDYVFLNKKQSSTFWNKTSQNIVKNIFYSCSKWTTSQQCRGLCWPFRDWCCCCCWRRVLLVFLFVEQNGVFCLTSHIHFSSDVGEKGVSIPSLKTACTSS